MTTIMKTAITAIWLRILLTLLALLDLLVLTLAFVLAVVPFALISRLAGRDPLRLANWRTPGSVWQQRADERPDPDFFERQF